jgi:single-strand selective monofunctional uracil DNA glycosylase
MKAGSRIREASRRFSRDAARLRLHAPVAYVYNPISYARSTYEKYTLRFASPRIGTLFLGMNPGPWGMSQTGVPFGEISFVRDWMGISGRILRPQHMHPRVPVLGLDCVRSEVSGRRFWGLAKQRFVTPEAFFKTAFVANYCPLMFLDERGGNLTPDKLSKNDRLALFGICDRLLGSLIAALEPRWVIGIGKFAESRAAEAAERLGWVGVKIGGILHPSPANPNANKDWAGAAVRALEGIGAWEKRRVRFL